MNIVCRNAKSGQYTVTAHLFNEVFTIGGVCLCLPLIYTIIIYYMPGLMHGIVEEAPITQYGSTGYIGMALVVQH